MYKAIKEHRPLFEIYAKQIGSANLTERVATIKGEFESAQKAALQVKKKPLAARVAKLLGQVFRRAVQTRI